MTMIPLASYLISTALASSSPQLAVSTCEFGESYQFSAGLCDITLLNQGDKPVRVFDFVPEIIGDAVEPHEKIVAPHEQAYLHAHVNTGNGLAGGYHKFRFRTDEIGHEDRFASVYGFIMTVLDQVKPELDFGIVNAATDFPQKSIELSSHDTTNFRITEILDKPAWLDASLGPNGHTLIAKPRTGAGWGIHADFVKLTVDTPQQKQAWVTVKADVHGEVVPASNPFDMGLMRFGNPNEFRIPLTSRSGKNFKIGKIELENVVGQTHWLPCTPPSEGCQMLVLTISDKQPSGSIQGHVWIEFPDFHQRLNLAVWGLLVGKDVKINTIDPEKLKNDTASKSDTSRIANPGSIDLGRAVKNAVNPANNVVPPGTGPLLTWTIANGMGIHGFQIFRADQENGTFVLLNSSTIPSIAETQDPIGYQWRDDTAKPGKTYWYYIGIVYNDGHKQQLTGPQKVVAK